MYERRWLSSISLLLAAGAFSIEPAFAQTEALEEVTPAPASEEESSAAATSSGTAPSEALPGATDSEGDSTEPSESPSTDAAPETPRSEDSTENSEELETAAESAESTEGAASETESAQQRATATKKKPRKDSIPDLRGAFRPTQRSTLGLDPGSPQAVGTVGGTTPSFGEKPTNKHDWLFDIHGYLLLPLRVGMNERTDPAPGQKKLVLHTPPSVPGNYSSFEYTGVNPDPWSQLNFSYGSSNVTATVIVAARTISNANGYFNPPDQLGINDAFITFHPGGSKDESFAINVGAFASRYGIMGQYDLGAYGTSLIGRVSGVGAAGTGRFKLGSVKMAAEAGLMGQLTKAPVGVEPAGWNGYTDPNVGTSFAAHAHLGAELSESVELGGHLIHTFSQDDRATNTTQKDGSISVYGADARFSMKRFGHLYLGYAHTEARTSRAVSSVIRVLGAPGGAGLMNEYFGERSEGTGSLDTFGLQYDFSLGNFSRYPKPFDGKGPDLVVSAFTVGTIASSPVEESDGVMKLKYGVAGTYSFLSWLGAGARYDLVMRDASDADAHHAIVSPRLVFKSDWGARDQVVLQYSRYFYGDSVTAAPPLGAPTDGEGALPSSSPDENVVSLTASMWW